MYFILVYILLYIINSIFIGAAKILRSCTQVFVTLKWLNLTGTSPILHTHKSGLTVIS